MGHSVNNDVDANSIGGQPILDRVAPVVYPFPRIAQIAVTSDEREKLAFIVLYAHIVRDYPAFLVSDAAVQKPNAWHLYYLVDVEVRLKNRMIEQQVFYGILRKHFSHLLPDIFPFIVAPEIVQKEETAAQHIFTQPIGFFIG